VHGDSNYPAVLRSTDSSKYWYLENNGSKQRFLYPGGAVLCDWGVHSHRGHRQLHELREQCELDVFRRYFGAAVLGGFREYKLESHIELVNTVWRDARGVSAGLGNSAIFNSGGSGTANLSADVAIGSITVSGFGGTLDLGGFSLSIATGATLASGKSITEP